MAKYINDGAADAALNYLKTNVNYYAAQSFESGGILAVKSPISSSDFTGPADGTVSGRKLTINEQAGVSVAYSGTASHVALMYYTIIPDPTSTYLFVTTCDDLALVSGGLVTFPAWRIEIADPT
jgi:hypothetical protein